jgi:hypothetical protein
MPANRSRSRLGHRPARRPHRIPGNKHGATLKAQGKTVATRIISAAEVASNATIVLIGFNNAVVAGAPASPGATDAVCSGTSATTRLGVDAAQVTDTFVRLRVNGSLSQSKTYHLHLKGVQGIVVPVNGVMADQTINFTT